MEGLFFKIGVQNAFSRPMKNLENQIKGISKSFEGLDTVGSKSLSALGNAVSNTVDQFKQYKAEQAAIKNKFVELSQSTDQYIGKTDEFMGALKNLGKEQKKLKDNFVANNELAKTSFLQSVGAMLARSTQSEKIAANLDRMNSPLYNVNQGLLKVSGGLEGIAKKGAPAVLALQQLGPTANMKELNDHVRLINAGIMRMGAVALASGIAFGLVTGAIIKQAFAVNKALEPLSERLKGTWAKAFEPLATVVGVVLEKVMTFATKIGEMVNRFNEAHPVLAKMIQSFMYLTLGLTVLLSPLAVGIGLFGGIKAAMYAVWMIIGPLVTGLATVVGTAALVAAGIVVLATAFIMAYKKIEWFRNGVDTAWAAIKSAFSTALNFIKGVVDNVMSSVSAFFGQKLAEIKAFWNQNGADIMAVVKLYFAAIKGYIAVVMSGIKAVFMTVWPIITNVVRVAWSFIKTLISNALTLIMGVIKVGLQVLKGDWSGAWQTIKDTTSKMMGNIISFLKGINLASIGRQIMQGFLNGISGMVGTIKSKVKEIAALIPNSVKKFLGIHSPSRVMMELGEFTSEGFLKGIGSMLTDVKGMSMEMAGAAIPKRAALSAPASQTTNSQTVNLTLHYNGNASREDADGMLDYIERGLNDRLGVKLRMNGVR